MLKIKQHKNLTIGLFAVYLIILVWLVLFKFRINISDLDRIRDINLIPFGASEMVNGHIFLQEIVYNILVFIPLGIYIHMLKPNWSFLQKIIPCLGISLLFEVLQFIFAIGRSDITDVIGNTLGGIIGISIYGLLKRIFKDKATTIVNVIALIASVLAILLLIHLKH